MSDLLNQQFHKSRLVLANKDVNLKNQVLQN